MNKKSIIIIVLIVLISLVIAGLYGTFASVSSSEGENVYNITLTGNSNEIAVPAGETKTVIYQITNTNNGTVQYGVTYSGDNIIVKVYDDSMDEGTGFIDYGENKYVKLLISNTGTTDSTLSIKTVLGYENGGSLSQSNIIPNGYSFVSESYSPPRTLIEHITNLYLNNVDSSNPVTFADGKGANYYASSVRLMNDTLDSTGAETGDYKIGNIRYYGADDENLKNYIYFNCSDYSDTTTCETWRIIGIVDGKVKIMRGTRLDTTYAWNENGTADWSASTLKGVLNEGGSYYTELETKNAQTIDLISESVWYANLANSGTYSNSLYNSERDGNSIWTGDIALVYPSDYGYSADLNTCRQALFNYDDSTCTSVNWMKNIITSNGGSIGLTLNPYDDSSVIFVHFLGWSNRAGNAVTSKGNVVPTVYLDTTLTIDSRTDGSSENPYKLVV